MIILACRKDCKTLGKVPMHSEETSEAKKAVEMEEKKPEGKDNENAGNVEVPMQAKPVTDALCVCWRHVLVVVYLWMNSYPCSGDDQLWSPSNTILYHPTNTHL